ncbi:MAG: nucleotidyltransferase domain-containing protein [Nanoarchaeota archaeon]|nr:nucleotidyltransferase domain-containing protein [Nanoarchaeota archaeon]MBU4451467.1 nucleotidyltransferase domain-containing protein [Nanoarchaeota archaeon]MCG2724302.1 nucleotidyltransferase domain-containing protein [archaeon]
MTEKYNINQTTLKILGLYRNNYKISMHVRAIARETKVDVKAIQMQLRRLERVNILSSAFKGKNKEYRLNLSNFAAKYHMTMAEAFFTIRFLDKNFQIKKVISEIGGKIGGTILLFGSFAKGYATKESDIDIFVIADKFDRSVIEEVGDVIGKRISVKSSSKQQFLNGLKNADPLISEVALGHITLKGMDDFCDILWDFYAR